MAIDEVCKNEIVSIIQSELNKIPILLQGMAKSKAQQAIMDFTKNTPEYDLGLPLSEYLETHPEIKIRHPMLIPLIPQCAYKYTMQDLIDSFHEISGKI